MVEVDFGGGLSDTMVIHYMDGQANPDTDVITITADAPSSYYVHLEICGPDWCDGFGLGDIGAGQIVVDMMADHDFDIQYGMSFEAQLHVLHNHTLLYSWALPAVFANWLLTLMSLEGLSSHVFFWGSLNFMPRLAFASIAL